MLSSANEAGATGVNNLEPEPPFELQERIPSHSLNTPMVSLESTANAAVTIPCLEDNEVLISSANPTEIPSANPSEIISSASVQNTQPPTKYNLIPTGSFINENGDSVATFDFQASENRPLPEAQSVAYTEERAAPCPIGSNSEIKVPDGLFHLIYEDTNIQAYLTSDDIVFKIKRKGRSEFNELIELVRCHEAEDQTEDGLGQASAELVPHADSETQADQEKPGNEQGQVEEGTCLRKRKRKQVITPRPSTPPPPSVTTPAARQNRKRGVARAYPLEDFESVDLASENVEIETHKDGLSIAKYVRRDEYIRDIFEQVADLQKTLNGKMSRLPPYLFLASDNEEVNRIREVIQKAMRGMGIEKYATLQQHARRHVPKK